jgi:uncharacterized protein involved in exopolysaccharide biosynthesis
MLGQNQLRWLRERQPAFAHAEAEQEAYRRAFADKLARQAELRRQESAARRAMVAEPPAVTPESKIPLWVQGIVFGAAMAVIVYGFTLWPES